MVFFLALVYTRFKIKDACILLIVYNTLDWSSIVYIVSCIFKILYLLCSRTQKGFSYQ